MLGPVGDGLKDIFVTNVVQSGLPLMALKPCGGTFGANLMVGDLQGHPELRFGCFGESGPAAVHELPHRFSVVSPNPIPHAECSRMVRRK